MITNNGWVSFGDCVGMAGLMAGFLLEIVPAWLGIAITNNGWVSFGDRANMAGIFFWRSCWCGWAW